MSDFDKGDLTWLKSVTDGAMDNLLSVGRAERTLLHIEELEAKVERLRESAEWWERNATQWCADCKKAWRQRDLSAAKYEAAEKELADAHGVAQACEARAERLQAEVARLQDMCERQLERMIRAGIADNAYTVEFQFKARAEAAEAKNERWQAEMDDACKKVLKMHQKLRAVAELPGKWRDKTNLTGDTLGCKYGITAEECADELEAILKEVGNE